MKKTNTKPPKSLTVMVPEGLVPAGLLQTVHELVAKYDLRLYLTTAQNLRLLNITEDNAGPVKEALAAAGAQLKGPGRFPLPRVCVGKEYCNLGVVDTFALSRKILRAFGGRENVKPKFKVAVAGCPASCSNVLTTDIGVKATRNGFDLYVGGKGGPNPRKGMRIGKGLDEEELLQMIAGVVDYHDRTTVKKQRMSKMIGNADFPFSEV